MSEQYKCPNCGMGFSLRSDHVEHMRCYVPHQWTGLQRGGDPTDAGSAEYVRYCKVCGMEDTCEDPLPACPGEVEA